MRKGKQPISMWLLAWVELAQAICAITTAGFYQPGWRVWMLFSCRWFERLADWELRIRNCRKW